MALKIVIGTKSGKCLQKELSSNEAEAVYGRTLGEELNGELFGFTGVKLVITGGSDASGFPMRKDLPGQNKKKILMTKGLGFRGKLRGKRFGGLRLKKIVAGNTVYDKTNQLNLKCTAGDEVVEAAIVPKAPGAKKK